MEENEDHRADWSAVDWDEITPRLLLYASRKMERRGWRGASPGWGEFYLSPEDVVHTAIAKTMSGERAWNPSRIDLFYHLIMVIKSTISNLVRSADNAQLRGETEGFERIPSTSADDPERVAEARSQLSHFLSFVRREHPDLERMVMTMVNDGALTAPELASKLGCSVRDIYNLRKRLRRAVESYSSVEIGD